MKRIFNLLMAGALSLQPALAQDTNMGTPNFLLIPQENVQVAPRGGYELRYNDNGGFFEMRYFGPIEQTDKSWWLVDGAVRGHFSDDDMQNYSGHAGVVYRERIKENTMVGANAYLDTVNDGQRTYNQASVGVEYE